MQKTSIAEKTLNKKKHSLKKPNLIMMEKDVISIHYPKMCIKIRCYVHTNLSLHKNAHKSQKVLTSYHKNRYIYTTTDNPVCDNTKTSLCYIHNNVEKETQK
jgi:hypothetical protein